MDQYSANETIIGAATQVLVWKRYDDHGGWWIMHTMGWVPESEAGEDYEAWDTIAMREFSSEDAKQLRTDLKARGGFTEVQMSEATEEEFRHFIILNLMPMEWHRPMSEGRLLDRVYVYTK